MDHLDLDHQCFRVVFAGTENSGLWKSTNGGVNWFLSSYNINVNEVRQVVSHPSNPQTMYAATWRGGIYKSVDGGGSWQAKNSGLGDMFVKAVVIDPTNPNILYAGTFFGGAFKSMDAGETWISIMSGMPGFYIPAMAVNPVQPHIIYAGTGAGVFTLVQTISAVERMTDTSVPKDFSLGQNYPNPFNPQTTIEFTTAEKGYVTINVYDLLGKQVATLAETDYMPGQYKITWDGRNNNGEQLPSGVYFYRMVSENFEQTRRLVFTK